MSAAGRKRALKEGAEHTAVLGALVAPLLVVTNSLAQPSANIGDYVLVADQELNARDLTIESGDVAVNNVELRSLSGLQAGSSRIAADQVDIDSTSTCDALFANVVIDSGGGCGPASPLAQSLTPAGPGVPGVSAFSSRPALRGLRRGGAADLPAGRPIQPVRAVRHSGGPWQRMR